MIPTKKQGIILALVIVRSTAGVALGQGPNVEYLNDVASLFSLILDVIYVLLWPLLVVAGRAMDNSLVLGKVLHLDRALWQFWIIMRNLANFALGFIVLRMIIKNLRSGSGDGKEVLKTVSKALFAGIGIQISRFVITALLDLSTIAIYAIGTLPMQTVPDSSSKEATHIIEPIINMNFENSTLKAQTNQDNNQESVSTLGVGDFLEVTYTCPNITGLGTYTPHDDPDSNPQAKSLQNCLIHDDYIVARRPDLIAQNGYKEYEYAHDPINHNYCIYQNSIITINSAKENARNQDTSYYYYPLFEHKEINTTEGQNTNTNESRPGDFNTGLKNNSNNDLVLSFAQEDNKRSPQTYTSLVQQFQGNKDSITALMCPNTIKDLAQRGQGMVGPLTTFYSSILRFGTITVRDANDSISRTSISLVIKSLFGLMLLAPLITLLLVLIKRVGYLWMVLVLSPITVLYETFGKDFGVNLPGGMEVVALKEAVGLIFLPVVTIFSMSLGLVFLSSVHNSMSADLGSNNNTILNEMGIREVSTGPYSCYHIFVTDLCFENGGSLSHERSSFKDHFSRTIMMLLGIGVMRTITFASFQASSVSKGLGEQISKLTSDLLLSARIIPIPGKGKVGLGSLGVGGGNNNDFLTAAQQHYQSKINTDVATLLTKNNDNDKNKANTTTNDTHHVSATLNNSILSLIPNHNTRTGQTPYNSTTIASNLNKSTNQNTAAIQELTNHINTSKDKKATITDNDTTYTITKNNGNFVVSTNSTP